MKKSRKILSVLLAILVAFASMPVLYVSTGAAETVVYASDSGTLENPTKPVEVSGKLSKSDLYKVNVSFENITYNFYQTIDNEYFTYNQTLGLQQVNSGAGSRTVMFESISNYTGASNVNGNADGASVGTQGYFESPVITGNQTSDFINNHLVSETWIASNENAKEVVSGRDNPIPYNFKIDGSGWDLSGCKVYSWNTKTVFVGAQENSKMAGTTVFYKSLKYGWDSTEDTTTADMDARLGTTINVIDARVLKKELLKAENIIKNPSKYTDEYVSSVKATYNSIPEDAKDFSTLYTQAEIDAFAQSLIDVSKNSADYTTYNLYYEELMALDNSMGAWTEDSFATFTAEVAEIDSGLPKNLDKTQQSRVDAAVQSLINAYDKLISTDVTESNDNPYTYTSNGDDGDMSFAVNDTTFKFMQTKDDQIFEYSQLWTITRDGGSTARKFKGMILETGYPLTENSSSSTCYSSPSLTENKTDQYINLLTDSSKATITADNEYQSITATELACWWEEQADGTPNETSSFVDAAGTLDSNRDFEYSDGKTYYIRNTPQIKGKPAGEYGSVAVNYVLRTGWTYKTGGLFGIGGTTHAAHIHVNSIVEITDVRQLIKAVDDAQVILATPEEYPDSYIQALTASVSAVSDYMLHGSKFYTQEEVDKLTTQITNVINNPDAEFADYTDFNTIFSKLSHIANEGKYTPSSFEAFQDKIYEINANLDKSLPVTQQSVVDDAVRELFDAEEILEYRHLNEDKTMTDINISDSLGNNPVSFEVSSTEYNFMQTHDGQEFVIKTDLTLKNNKSSYKSKLLSLKISQLDKDSLSVCANRTEPDTGCHYGENVLRNDYQTLLANVTSGLNVFEQANEAGDIAEFNTWRNVSGTALTSNGIITDGVELSNTDSSASAIMTYKGASDGAENLTAVELQYALRLGWSYQEIVLGIEGDSISRHAHIPVTLNITDARALSALYKDSMNAVLGKTEETYTLETLEKLYNVLITVPEDMVYGDSYYTQEQVNDAYNKLKSAYDTLKEGADYSEYFAECVKADKVISLNNTDEYGNKLYTDEAYETYVNTVTEITSTMDKNLDATPENQAIVDNATQALKDAMVTLEEGKLADYSEFSKQLEMANEILNSPEGTYTDETIETVQNAVNNANGVAKGLPASEQATVDEATALLSSAVEDALFRADYTAYEEALKNAQAIKNDDGKYTDSAYAAFTEKLVVIDEGLDKNLPDYAVNRQTIQDAINEINEAISVLESNKKGDYTEYDNALKEAQDIVNDDGSGNLIYAPEAFEDFKNTVASIDSNLDKDLTEHQQSTIDDATQSIKNAQNTLEENRYADYSQLEANMQEVQKILDAPEGTYTDKTVAAAQSAMDKANALDEGMVVGAGNVNQNAIDEASNALSDVLANAEEKADYSSFEDAVAAAEDIKNDTTKVYTDKTLQAIEEALASAEAMDKDLSKDNQSVVDNITAALEKATAQAEEKADYSEFETVVEALENIVNSPENTYTDDTVNKAQEALNKANDLDKDLSNDEENQALIDNLVNEMQSVIDNAEKKADYTDHDNIKQEIEDIVNSGNTDANGDKIYDDGVFEELKNTLADIDSNLDKDLPDTQQDTVDNATAALEDIKNKIENSKIYTVTFMAEDGSILASIDYTNGTALGDIVGKPALPEGTETFKYIGWATEDDTLYTDSSSVTGDITLYVAGEFVKIDVTADGTLNPDDAKGIITGIDKNTAVSIIKEQLENDLTYIEIKDYTGKILADEELVGSGSTITLRSKYTDAVYEVKTVIIYGDVDGDGDVDNDDYSIAKGVNIGAASYATEQNYFFLANDVNGDGYIDVLDSSLIALIKRGKLTVV